MSAPGARLAPQPASRAPREKRGPLAHLLHALNQPLTGLQCSLELAVARPRNADEQLCTLRESLELTARIRILVEALRELVDTQEQEKNGPQETFLLNALLHETAEDLRLIAEAKKVHLGIVADTRLPVRAARSDLAATLFRSLEASLSLARAGTDIEISAEREADHAVLRVSWRQGARPELSPFSRPELGLLIARAGWVRAGAECLRQRTGDRTSLTARLPLAWPPPDPAGTEGES